MAPATTKTVEELREELDRIQFTKEVMPDKFRDAMDSWDREEMEELFYELPLATPSVIRRIRRLTRKYPAVQPLRNHLIVACVNAGRTREARALIAQTFADSPDYLFAKANYAALLIDNETGIDRIPRILGETLNLRDLEQERQVFHVSEIKAFYKVVALYYIRKNRVDLAREILNYLQGIVDDDSELDALASEVMTAGFKALSQRRQEEEVRAIRVVSPGPELRVATELRPFTHPEVEALLRGDTPATRDSLPGILTLERSSLIADLETLLDVAIRNRPLLSENEVEDDDEDDPYEDDPYEDDPYQEGPGYALTALNLLGALRASEALPAVLRFLDQPADVLWYWCAYEVEEEAWEPVFHIVGSRLEDCLKWMLSPGVSPSGRAVVAASVAQIALHHPGRRAEVEDWFHRIFAFLRDVPVSANILDSQLLTELIRAAVSVRAVSTLPLVATLYEKGYVFESFVGNFAGVASEMGKPPEPLDVRPLCGFPHAHQDFRDGFDFGPDPEEADQGIDWLDHRRPAPALFDGPMKVGRNDPCPCGSGKKHKKCCGKTG